MKSLPPIIVSCHDHVHGKCGQQSKNPLVQICLEDVKQKKYHDSGHTCFSQKALSEFRGYLRLFVKHNTHSQL